MKKFAVLLALLTSLAPLVFAQQPVARRSIQSGPSSTATPGVNLGVFAAGSYWKLDEGSQWALYTSGIQAGIDVTKHFGRTAISVEPTFGRSSDPDETLKYFMGNVLFGRELGSNRRLRPFAVLGIGYGIVHYPGLTDNAGSILRNLGGGVSYSITHNFDVRAHWEYQFWDVGPKTDGFNPNGIHAGLLYHFGIQKDASPKTQGYRVPTSVR